MTNLAMFVGNSTLNISEAMQKIDENSYGLLFIVNEQNIMIGCVSDGDIRRFLLNGGKVNASVIDAANKNPRKAHTLSEAEKLYDGRSFRIIPIVDENDSIIDFYCGTLKSTIPHKPLNIPVVINAGGRGTRLDPFTKILPKPLIPVGDFPIIELIMQEYKSYSCNDFHIIVNYKKELIKAYFHDSEKHYNITWYDEEKPLGTGGGLSLLRAKLDSTFFFANCDVLLTTNYESMIKFHKEQGNAITMVCAYKNVNIPYGVVEIGEQGIIETMKEKPLMSFLINTGIYIVESGVINDIEDGVNMGFPDIVEMERQKGKRVAVFPVSENDWMDMGQLSELEKMRTKLYGE